MSLKLNKQFFNKLVSQANESPRKRSHYNLHNDLNEPVQRLCIALLKGTYVRPHHHPQANKWELMLTLRGQVCLIIFDKNAAIIEKHTLCPGESITPVSLSGVELKPNTWHTVIPLTDNAIILEVKEGPYTPTQESDFASWAPKEGDEQAVLLLNWLETAEIGDKFKHSNDSNI